MKTITMDFETYEKELIEAKQAGFEIRSATLKALREVSRVMSSATTRNDFSSVGGLLSEVINDLTRAESKGSNHV